MAMGGGVRKREREGEKTPTRYFSKKQEDAVAKAVGGNRTPNSGATPWVKGDVLTNGEESFLIECKTKTVSSKSITIQKDWFTKNKEEMVFQGKQHEALAFNFGPNEEMHYIIDEYLFQELLEHLRNKQ